MRTINEIRAEMRENDEQAEEIREEISDLEDDLHKKSGGKT